MSVRDVNEKDNSTYAVTSKTITETDFNNHAQIILLY